MILLGDVSMKKLKCELCGSVEITKVDNDVFKCDHCRCKYTTEQVKLMVSGVVETVTGGAELERQLNAVRQLTELGEYHTAIDKSKKLTVEFPHDYRVWWEAAYANAKYAATEDQHEIYFTDQSVSKGYNHFSYYKNAVLLANESQKAEMQQKWDLIWQKFVPNIESGTCFLKIIVSGAGMQLITYNEWATLINEISSHYPVFSHIIKRGIDNAKTLSDAGIFAMQYPRNDYSDPVYEWARFSNYVFLDKLCFIYGNIVITSRENRVHSINGCGYLTKIEVNTIGNIQEEIRKRERLATIDGKCPHCRTKLSGVFGKRCKNCNWQAS